MTSPINIRETSPALYPSASTENAATRNAAPADRHPPQLYRSRINDASLLWVEDYAKSADPAQVNIATTALKAIKDNALSLGKPSAQNEKNSRYGARLLDSEKKACTLVADFRPRRTGDFDLTLITMRDEKTKKSIEPRPPHPTIEPTDQEAYDKNESLAMVGNQQNEENKLLLMKNKKTIKSLINSLSKWEKGPCLALIEKKLQATPLSEHQLLLQSLTVKLSNTKASDKHSSIDQWARGETADRVLERRDQRSFKEKQLQDKLASNLKDSKFLELHEEICESIPLTQRSQIRRISVISGKFTSPLYARVFSGKQSPFDNMQSLKEHMDKSKSLLEYEALLDWKSTE